MKTDRKPKAEKSPPKVKAVKETKRAVPKTNGKHPLAAYEHIPVGIVESSLEGRYMDVNEEFCRILGYSRRELLRRGIKDCTHEDDYAIDSRLYEQLIAGKIPFYRIEKRFWRKDGGIIWVELTRSLVCDDKGNPLYTVGVVLDISDRKDVEKVLRESVERLRLATAAARMFMWEWDFQSQSYVIADNFEQVLGFSGGLLPKNKFDTLWALSPKEDVDRISQEFEGAVQDQRDLHALPYRVVNPENGQVVWLEISAKIVYDRDGNPQRMFGVAQNITESKNIQNEITVISRMPEENPNPVMRITRDGRISYANPSTAALLEDWMQGLQPVLPDELQKTVAQTLTSGLKTETEFDHLGKHFSFTVVPLVESGYVNLYGKDITERKQAEQALRSSEERMRLAMEASRMVAWEWDPTTDRVTTSENITEVYGLSAVDGAAAAFSLIWPEDLPAHQEKVERVTRDGGEYHSEFRVTRPLDGRVIWMEERATALTGPAGQVTRLVGVVTDITERKQMETALRESEERFRAMVSQTTAGIAESDMDSRLVFVNPGFSQMLGYSEEELLGKTIWELTYTEDIEENKRLFKRLLEQGESYQFEKRFLRKDGSSLWTSVSVTTINDLADKPKGGVGVVLDIDKRKQAEADLAGYARQQEALFNLSDQLYRTGSLQEVYNAALDAIINALHCNRASILLYDESDVMRFVAWRGLSDPYRQATEGHSPWKPDAKDPKPISMDDIRTADLDESLRFVLQGEGIGSLAFIPLVSSGKLIGKFMVYFDVPHVFKAEELDLSLTIAHQLATGIDRKRAEEELRQSEERFRQAANASGALVYEVDLVSGLSAIVHGLEHLTGYDPQEIAASSEWWHSLIHPDDLPTHLTQLDELLNKGGTDVCEYCVLHKNGEWVFVQDNRLVIKNAAGQPVRLVGAVIDITERKRSEEALRRERELLGRLIETMPVMVSMIDPSTNSMRLNAEFERQIGWKSEEVTALSLLEALYPDPEYREHILERMAAAAGTNEWVEVQVRTRDGRTMDSMWSNISIMEDGKLVMGIAIGIDITERKQTEKRLALLAEISDKLRNFDDPHELLYTISEAVGEHLQVKRALFNEIDLENDLETVHRDYHKGWESVEGIHRVSDYSSATSAEVAAGRTVVNKDSKTDPRTAQDYEKTYALSGERAYVVVPLMRDNRWVASLWVSDDTPRQWSSEEVSLLETVAERTWAIIEKLRINTALRESEQRYRAVVESQSEMLCRFQPDGTILFANGAYARARGTTPEALTSHNFWDFIREEERASVQAMLDSLTPEAPQVQIENRFHTVDGERWTLWTNRALRFDSQGRVLEAQSSGIDITERKQAEEALRASEERMRLATDAAGMYAWEFDVQSQNLTLSDNFADVIGFPAELVLENNIEALQRLSPAEDAELVQEAMEQAFEMHGDLRDVQYRILNPENGQVAWVEVNARTIYDRDGKPQRMYGVSQNITERKRIEEALRIENERFMRFVDSNIVGILIGDASGQVIVANDYYLRLLGISREEFNEGKVDWKKFTPSEWLPADEKAIQELRERGVCDPYEKEYIRTDGTRVPVYIADALLPGPGQEIAAFVLDITERKRAENALRIRAQQQQAVARLGELALRERDLQKVFDEATATIAETLEIEYCKVLELLEGGRSLLLRAGVGWQEGLVGNVMVSTGLDSQAGFTLQSTAPVIVEDLRYEQRFKGPPLLFDHNVISGMSCIIRGLGGLPWGVLGTHSTRHVSFTQDDVNFLVSMANILSDAIQREEAEEALRASEERYRFIVENTSDGIWWVELREPMPISLTEEEQLEWYYRHAVMRQCNLGLAHMYGFDSLQDVVGLPMRILMPREIPENLELLRQFIRSGYRLVDAESREVSADGRELVFLNNMVGIVEGGKLIGEWGTNRDITERKRAEEALRRNEQMFSTLVDAAPFGVYFIDSEFRLRAINKGSEGVFSGIDPLIGRDFAEVLRIVWQEPFATETIERFRHTLRTGESFISPPIVEERANIDEIEAYDWQIHRITLSDGSYGVVCYFYDLSEQKRMEATVRASESLYRAIARNIPGGGVYVVDKDFRYLVAEGPVTEAFGLTREMLEGHTVSEAFPDESGERTVERLKRTFAGERLDFETHFNGRVYWTQQAPLHESLGHAIILTLDITERKQAEEALRQSDERFARFMQHLPGLAWIKDIEGRYVYANAAAERAFRATPENLYGRMDEEIFPPHVAAQFRRNDAQALTDEKGVQVIETLEQEDGVLHYSLVSKFPIPGPDGRPALIGGTAVDITERLQAEEALRESEERFRAILRQATAGIVRKDAEGRLIFVNEAFCNMLGRTEAELLGKTMWEFMHEDDIAESKSLYERMMLESIPFKLERRLLREDGSMIWVDASVSPIMDVTGRPQSAVAVEVDITGRKQAEEELRQLNLQLEDRVLSRTERLRSVNQTLREEIQERQKAEEALRKSEADARANEEKLSTLFELLPVGISFLDPQGQIIQMNPALTNILKLSKEQLMNERVHRSRKYIRSNGTPMAPTDFASWRALQEGKTVYNVETGVVVEDQEVIWTSVSAAPVNVADVGAVVVTADITESKRAERALQDSRERLQFLSQRLVEVQEDERRAIARELHDRVGQTLAALNINLIIISSQLGGKVDEQTSTRLNDSMKLVAETIALVRDVMSNLRPSVLDDYGLEAAIDSHVSQYTSRYEIGVNFEKPAQPLPRLGPSIEMTFLRIAQEALMNIARHAQATQVDLRLWQENGTVCMAVEDNGTGIISWQTANRPGSHGLTIMRERAEAFGGNLKVSSVPGKGTKVEVKIPVETSDPSQTPKKVSP